MLITFAARLRFQLSAWPSTALTLRHLSSVQSLSCVRLFATPWTAAARPPCSSPTPGVHWVHPNPCPFSRWCHPTISSSVVPFSFCPQSFPTSGSFQMSHLFTSGGQNIGSFTFNISPSSEHPGLISFRMAWLDILAVWGTLKSLLQFKASLSLWSNSHIYTWLLGKSQLWLDGPLLAK